LLNRGTTEVQYNKPITQREGEIISDVQFGRGGVETQMCAGEKTLAAHYSRTLLQVQNKEYGM
jgi:hypothetical protein